jgi:drug/metabolite transporter (DMT)-like permease
MAYFMLHESISLRQFAGMILALVSIVLMAL